VSGVIHLRLRFFTVLVFTVGVYVVVRLVTA